MQLLDWRRRISELYRAVRENPDPRSAWQHWREVRDELFASHPQSPLTDEVRKAFQGLSYFDYDEGYRVTASIEVVDPTTLEIEDSGGGQFTFSRSGRARFEISGEQLALDVFWLSEYSGGVFVSFRDTTSGKQTYGAARYLLDTAKGADLGGSGSELIFDFNFAYNPSCAYDPRWVCPLAPPGNLLEIAIEAGERLQT